MRNWTPEQIASVAGAQLIAAPGSAGAPRSAAPASDGGPQRAGPARNGASPAGPERVVIDSRQAGPGTLFVGLRGQSADGGQFARAALAAGAWGVLTSADHARAAAEHARASAGHAVRRAPGSTPSGVLLATDDPLAALQRLAAAWRAALGARVIGITGSTGKTSTKDLINAVLSPHRRTVASRANFNTEIGLPLEILAAPAGTEVLVLEMGMRGTGQIAELAAIAQPDVAVIVSVGPVHLELLGTVEAVAAAKAELIAGLPAGGTAVIPADEPLLAPYLRDDVTIVTFADDGDVQLLASEPDYVEIGLRGRRLRLALAFTQAHLRRDLLAAVAAADAVGVTPSGRLELALTPGRGQRVSLPDGVTLIDDCYNANPMSMRAALDDLTRTAAQAPHGRRVAILGDMLELGPGERDYHVELGRHLDEVGVDVLVTVGPLAEAIADGYRGEIHAVEDATQAAAIAPRLLARDDFVLVKGSRGVGLELVCRALGGGGR
ncbi:MAG: UDP-N-acetylmuramoyl-tripeptide--D-alanyl-D-alanine ligase [Solirubrobacteraceae bacterium]